MFRFTEMQGMAVYNFQQNHAVMAGAGAGKTRVLVERYLNLLYASQRPLNSVVAVTFTEKAAAEMRVRVRDRLTTDYAHPATPPARRARAAGLLRQIDSARINTIHSLCGEVLRASAAEAGIDPQFAILDEVNAVLLLQAAIEDVLRDALAEGTLEPLIAFGCTVDEVRTMLIKVTRAGVAAPPVPAASIGLAIGVGGIADAAAAFVRAQMTSWRAAWRSLAAPLIDGILASPDYADCLGYAPPPGFPKAPDKLSAALEAARAVLADLHTPPVVDADDTDAVYAARAAALLRAVDLPKVGGAGTEKNWGDKETKAGAHRVVKQVRAWGETLADHPGAAPSALDERAARMEPLWRALIAASSRAFTAAKAAAAALDFNDLERLTHNLLTGPHSATVRERFESEIAALLVDEFQDTNPVQWALLSALADPAQPGRIFVVGDAKQSIYAFRGADVAVFAQARQQIEAAGGKMIPFKESFRAHTGLIAAFNDLFAHILQPQHTPPLPFETRYDPHTDAMIAQRTTQPAPDEAALEVLLVPGKASEAAVIARRIQQMVGGVPVQHGGADRPAQYSDIAILLPAMTETVVVRLEAALRAAGIPFVTTAGRGYFARQEIKDMIALLRVLEAPGDDLALATVLRSPLFAISDEALLALRIPPAHIAPALPTAPALRDPGASAVPVKADPLPLWEALRLAADDPAGNPLLPADDHAPLAFAWRILKRLHRLAGRVSIADLLTTALTETGYLATLERLPVDGARRRSNVEKLVDLARGSGAVRVFAFNQHVEALKAAEAREGEAPLDGGGAVQIMTIHKSKGLEFPIVFVMHAHHAVRPHDAPLMHDADLGLLYRAHDADGIWAAPFAYRMGKYRADAREDAERRRVLYVAMTRAADRCIVSGKVTGLTKDDLVPKAAGMLGWLLDAITYTTGAGAAWSQLGEIQDAVAKSSPSDAGADDPVPPVEAWRARLTLIDPANFPPEPDGDEAVGDDDLLDDQAVGDDQTAAARQMGDPPALLRPLPLLAALLRTLTASLMADIGAAHHADPSLRPAHRQQARRRLLDDVPNRPRRASPVPVPEGTAGDQAIPRLIGDLVHQALRWRDRWSVNYDERRKTLEHFAWENGITDDGLRARVMDEAIRLLHDELDSDVQGWIASARRVFRETPFAYRLGAHAPRTVHGVIDVLIERDDGRWAIIDYKTACVPGRAVPAHIERHAQRYILQLGVYAAAATELIALRADQPAPDVYLRYIRHQHTVQISTAAWRAELASFEERLGAVMDDV